jgi:hypothetical protein
MAVLIPFYCWKGVIANGIHGFALTLGAFTGHF